MIRSPLAVLRIALVCLPLVLVASCGNSGTEAVQGSTINMNPDAVGQAVPANGTSSLVNEEFTIEVRSPSGDPQININLSISSPGQLFSVDTSANPHTYTPLGPPGLTYPVITDSNGVYTVALSITSGIGSDGEVTILTARSGTAYNRVNITYDCFDVGAITCP